jgi:hypothetical protein
MAEMSGAPNSLPLHTIGKIVREGIARMLSANAQPKVCVRKSARRASLSCALPIFSIRSLSYSPNYFEAIRIRLSCIVLHSDRNCLLRGGTLEELNSNGRPKPSAPCEVMNLGSVAEVDSVVADCSFAADALGDWAIAPEMVAAL